jgi:hypothetical protein
MMMSLIAALIATGGGSGAPDEIVVTARPGKCVVEMAKRPLSSVELDRLEKIWAVGTPVRVIRPRGADDRCVTKIMFELARKGVTRAEFVNQTEDR